MTCWPLVVRFASAPGRRAGVAGERAEGGSGHEGPRGWLLLCRGGRRLVDLRRLADADLAGYRPKRIRGTLARFGNRLQEGITITDGERSPGDDNSVASRVDGPRLARGNAACRTEVAPCGYGARLDAFSCLWLLER